MHEHVVLHPHTAVAHVGTVLAHRTVDLALRQIDSRGAARADDSRGDGGLVQQLEPIDGETALRERLLLGLRLRAGVDLGSMAAELGVEAWPRDRRRAADRLIARGRLVETGSTLTIPASQWLLADDTIASLL